MKKTTALILSVLLVICIFAGCGASENSDGISYNDKFDPSAMVTASGEKIDIDPKTNAAIDPSSGLGLHIYQDFKDAASDSVQLEPFSPYGFKLIFLTSNTKTGIEELVEEKDITKEEFQKKLMDLFGNTPDILAFIRVNEKEPDSAKLLKKIKSDFAKNEKIAEFGDDSYYILYNDSLKDAEGITDEDNEIYGKITAQIPVLKDNLFFFPPENPISPADAGLTSFTAEDMEGNSVTQDIFADYDITMINVWATWCGFCIEEMPYLQQLHDSLPENVNLISIAADADKQADLVTDILKESNVSFTTLKGGPGLAPILSQVTGYPTTFFVDSKGNLVGQPISGIPARGDKIPQAYMDAINRALDSLGE